MKKLYRVVSGSAMMLATYMLVSAVSFTAQAENNKVSEDTAIVPTLTKTTLPTGVLDARFTIQNHDIAVDLLKPSVDAMSKTNHPVVTGCHVAVLISDRFEITSVQCHWKGLGFESSKYIYTLFYRLRDDKDGSIFSYSLNLLDFMATRTTGEGEVQITSMGVKPEDGIVSFRTAPFGIITENSDVRQLIVRMSK